MKYSANTEGKAMTPTSPLHGIHWDSGGLSRILRDSLQQIDHNTGCKVSTPTDGILRTYSFSRAALGTEASLQDLCGGAIQGAECDRGIFPGRRHPWREPREQCQKHKEHVRKPWLLATADANSTCPNASFIQGAKCDQGIDLGCESEQP